MCVDVPGVYYFLGRQTKWYESQRGEAEDHGWAGQDLGRASSSEVNLQQVAQATLALLVYEVFTLAEAGAFERWAHHRSALGHHHWLPIQF